METCLKEMFTGRNARARQEEFNDIRDLHKSLLKLIFSYFIHIVIIVTIFPRSVTFAFITLPRK
ncbi:MAG TPA: hypothetical protein DEA84_01690 [Erwinia persicina]|nr:hypothetical protein [Erwinia persicina]